MKLGIVGTGMIVRTFLPEILTVDGIEVSGIYGRCLESAAQLCDRFGIRHCCASFQELCRCGIDTVYIAVSNVAHLEYCFKALEMGLNVIVEKPMTTNYAEARFLQQLAVERKLFLFEAITTLHIGTYLKLQQWLPRIGPVRYAVSNFTQRSSRLDAFLDGTSLPPVFDPKQAGGCLMDLNIYNLYFLVGLLGKPDSAHYDPNIQNEIDTSGILFLRYPNFWAQCYAAKDSEYINGNIVRGGKIIYFGGANGSFIQGENGWLATRQTPNKVGEVVLHLNDGSEERFDDGSGLCRGATEFRIFRDAIDSKKYDFCYGLLDTAVDVSKILTEVRLNAGIHFPGDDIALRPSFYADAYASTQKHKKP